jgi:hypothetical protein
MEIRNSSHLPLPSITAIPAQQIASLKLGAILDVIVQERLGESRFQLQQLPGGVSLTGFSNLDLPIGHRLQVQVIRLGATPELRILPSTTVTEEVVPQALRELLPKQVDIGELTRLLGRLSAPTLSHLPDSVRLAIESLTAAMPQSGQLGTPQGLQKAVRNSGLFLEATLAAMLTDETPLPGNDLKARLLNLLAALQESSSGTPPGATVFRLQEKTAVSGQAVTPPPEMQGQNRIGDDELTDLDNFAQKVEGALAKITVDQLASLPRDNGAVSLQMNIPVMEGLYEGNVKLAINSEGSAASGENGHTSWTATIELQPPGIGKFNARVVWNGTRIDACLWSDREETGLLMRSYCEQLRERLEQAGLETGNITLLDRPPQLSPSEASTPPLLDLRA